MIPTLGKAIQPWVQHVLPPAAFRPGLTSSKIGDVLVPSPRVSEDIPNFHSEDHGTPKQPDSDKSNNNEGSSPALMFQALPRKSSALIRLVRPIAGHTRIHNMAHTGFPSDLPKPIDDGACNHLTDFTLPSIKLAPTSDPTKLADVSTLPGLSIIFCYPRTGAPNEKIPPEWDAIPGARGCTPQACSFREYLPDLRKHGVENVYGLSTQSTAYQQELRERTHLSYDLLSDEELKFAEGLNLPTFEYKDTKLINRLSVAIEEGKIVKWLYPVFPPDGNVHEILEWLKARN